jgi:uncharacterized membrane protein YuzA (DUF378 family)
MKITGWIAFILVIIGALNWGLVGFFNWNLVDAIFGVGSTMARVIYALVGVSGLWVLFTAPKMMSKE